LSQERGKIENRAPMKKENYRGCRDFFKRFFKGYPAAARAACAFWKYISAA